MSAPEPAGSAGPQERGGRRSALVPLLVAVVAAAIAVGGWWVAREPASDTPDAGASATTEPGTAEPGMTDPGTAEPEDSTAAPTESEAPTSTQPPVVVGDLELTPPAEFTYPSGDADSWVAPLEERGAEGPYALGEADAPVVMIMYSEFQCPFCRQFSVETMPELMPFVEDGTLQVQWRDFPYLGPESSLAALGGRTAAAQDMFWEYHDAVYALGADPNSGAFTEESLADLAAEAGLDRERFVAELNTVEQQEQVVDDQDEGIAMGVVGTPAFFINGMPIRGAQPTEVFVEAVEQAATARQQ